jgi:hypothetical protein
VNGPETRDSISQGSSPLPGRDLVLPLNLLFFHCIEPVVGVEEVFPMNGENCNMADSVVMCTILWASRLQCCHLFNSAREQDPNLYGDDEDIFS